MVAVSPAGPAQAASGQSFAYTGATQTFNVPQEVDVLSAMADGGQGAAGAGSGAGGGGTGGITSALLNVSTTPVLNINVGGKGSGATGGFNGGGNGGTVGHHIGGGGGGASDIETPTGTRLLVAAGGGGGGGTSLAHDGGDGGAGSQAGNNGAKDGSGSTAGGAAAAISSGNGGTGANGATRTFGADGGAGGGGGGGYAGGAGGGGGASGLITANGGGGGGSGNAFTSGSGATYGTGATGNGSVILSWLHITTSSLPDGVAGTAYGPVQLTATGGTAYNWTEGGGLAACGLTLSSAGVLSGATPTACNVTETFTVTDANGLQSSVPLEVDIVSVTPGTSYLLGGATTGVGITSATGNGTAVGNGGSTDITGINCQISTASNLSGAKTVAASPNTVTAAGQAPFTCAFTGLTANTTYYYNVFATANSGATISGQSVDSFTTEPKSAQTFNAPFPKRIKYRGLTTLLSKTSKTSAGKTVQIKLSKSSKAAYDNRGDMRFYKLVKGKNGKRSVQTYGHKFYLKVTYYAAGTSTVDAYSQSRVYLVHK